MLGTLYRYPHPSIEGIWIYVGQGSNRDYSHRTCRSSFGRRFKKLFPDAELPQPIKEDIEIESQFELNELETIWMFRYHTWHGYADGMNLTFPGAADYETIGKIGGKVGGLIGGKIVGRMCVEKKIGLCGRSTEKMSKDGHKGGLVAGRKSVTDKTGVHAPGFDKIKNGQINGRINGQRNVESGHMARLNQSLTKEHCSIAGVIGTHNYRHIKQNRTSVRCVLCSEQNLVVAWS